MLTLPSELTHAQAADCLQRLLPQITGESTNNPVIMDAAALASFDSSALAVLLECRRTATKQKRNFAVRHLPPLLASLAGLYGVQVLLPSC